MARRGQASSKYFQRPEVIRRMIPLNKGFTLHLARALSVTASHIVFGLRDSQTDLLEEIVIYKPPPRDGQIIFREQLRLCIVGGQIDSLHTPYEEYDTLPSTRQTTPVPPNFDISNAADNFSSRT